MLLGTVTLTGAMLLSFERGAELLNFGAFIAFIGVNLAAFIHYRFRTQEKVPFPGAIPLAGVLICAFIWLHLTHAAQLLGAAWMGLGLAIHFLIRSRGTSRAAAEAVTVAIQEGHE